MAAFPQHPEQDRRNSVRTRNNRLAAIHSLFGYAALQHPEHAGSIQRVLAIPTKRCERNLVTVQTGLRVSELMRLTCSDVHLGAGANVHTVGKGRKERRTPLVPLTMRVLRAWLAERDGNPAEPVFPTRPAGRSAETPSSIASPTTRPRRRPRAVDP